MKLAAFLFLAISLNAANWYVDNSLTNSANTGTNWANAWTNFQSVVWWQYFVPGTDGVKRGDTLYISGGTASQTYAESMDIRGNDIVNSGYKTISPGVDAGHNGTVIIDGWQMSSHTNGIYWNFAGGHVHLTGTSDYRFLIRGITNLGSGRGTTAKACQGGMTDALIEYVTVTNCGNGIELNGSSNNIVRFCRLYDIQNDGAIIAQAQLASNPGHLWDATLIHDCVIQLNLTNYFSGAGPDGIQGTDGVTVSNCTIYGLSPMTISSADGGPQHQDCIQPLGSGWKVCYNKFYDFGNSVIESNQGVNGTRPYWTNYWVFNNLVYMSKSDSTNFPGFARGVEWEETYNAGVPVTISDYTIENNTFVDLTKWAAISLYLRNTNSVLTNVIVRNNITYNCGYTASNPTLRISCLNGSGSAHISSTNWDSSGIHITNNILFPGSLGNSNIIVNGSSYVDPTTRVSAPAFTSYSLFNPANVYSLSSTDTVAIGNASVLTSFTDDILHNQRGSTWDIGAYEYVPPQFSAGTVRAGRIVRAP